MCKGILMIVMNTGVAVATVGIFDRNLAYTRLGSDTRWIDLRPILNYDSFQDVVTHKDGLFCAVDRLAHKVFVLDFSSPTVTFIDIMTLNLPPYEENNGWACFQQARFVNSSSELFLVRWRNLIKKGEKKRREAEVYKLMDDVDAEKNWVPVKSLGNFSFVLGTNQSLSRSTTDFPRLRSNCVYIPHDAIYKLNIEDGSVNLDDRDFLGQLIYDLGDGS